MRYLIFINPVAFPCSRSRLGGQQFGQNSTDLATSPPRLVRAIAGSVFPGPSPLRTMVTPLHTQLRTSLRSQMETGHQHATSEPTPLCPGFEWCPPQLLLRFSLPLVASNTTHLVHRGIQSPEDLEMRPPPEQAQLPLCGQKVSPFYTERITAVTDYSFLDYSCMGHIGCKAGIISS